MTFPIPPDLPADEHPIIKTMLAARRRLLRRDAAALRELAGMYAKALDRLKADRNALLKVIRESAPDRDQLIRLASFDNLIAGLRREMTNLAKAMAGNLSQEILAELGAAGDDGLLLAQTALPGLEAAYIRGRWVILNPDQVTTMFGFLDPTGPLIAGIRTNYGPALAEFIRETIATGFIAGMNPRDVARLIAQALGEGLNWAMTTARTAHLWAYRAAAHQNYLNNSWVVKGWTWFAQLDDRVCMSCVAQHGSEHPLTEILADHHQGRCAPLPITRSYAELGFPDIPDLRPVVPSGETWFRAQPAVLQRRMMGPGKWAAWNAGKFDFSQLTVPYNDPVYGRMLRENSLKGILGGDLAQLFYGGKTP